jgi:arylsulfatase A-like enzyme
MENRVKGGYTDAAGTVTAEHGDQLVDAAIGQMVADLKEQGLLETTLIIVTAKHGQPASILTLPGTRPWHQHHAGRCARSALPPSASSWRGPGESQHAREDDREMDR